MFLAAAEQNNVEALSALLHGPVPLIAPEIQRRGLEARAERLWPEEVAQLRQSELLLDYAVSVKGQLIRWLQELGADGQKIVAVLGSETATSHDGAVVEPPVLSKVS